MNRLDGITAVIAGIYILALSVTISNLTGQSPILLGLVGAWTIGWFIKDAICGKQE